MTIEERNAKLRRLTLTADWPGLVQLLMDDDACLVDRLRSNPIDTDASQALASNERIRGLIASNSMEEGDSHPFSTSK